MNDQPVASSLGSGGVQRDRINAGLYCLFQSLPPTRPNRAKNKRAAMMTMTAPEKSKTSIARTFETKVSTAIRPNLQKAYLAPELN